MVHYQFVQFVPWFLGSGVLELGVILFGDEMKIGVETSGNHFKHNAYGINIIKSCIFHLD